MQTGIYLTYFLNRKNIQKTGNGQLGLCKLCYTYESKNYISEIPLNLKMPLANTLLCIPQSS